MQTLNSNTPFEVLTAQPGSPALIIEDEPKSSYLVALEAILAYVHVLHDLAMEDSEHYGTSVSSPHTPGSEIVFTEDMEAAWVCLDVAFNS
jgi:hypothetical protein